MASSQKLIIPPPIRRGDTIAFVSPSAGLAPFAMHRIERAKSFFEAQGFKVKHSAHALENHGYVSSEIEDRVKDLHAMFLDPEVKLIMATIGGDHSNQLLKFLDFKTIQQHPKIFMGYSDITVLHYAFYTQCGLATYYGPCVMTQFGEFPEVLEYTLNSFQQNVMQPLADIPVNLHPSATWTQERLDWFEKKDLGRARTLQANEGYEWLRHGTAEGAFIGGTIPSINHLIGTRYWIDPTNKIFFFDLLKEDGISLSGVDSFLADLDNIDFFGSIKGLVVGRPYAFSQEEIQQLKLMIMRYTEQNKIPILFNVNIGHTDPILTIRYGSKVRLQSDTIPGEGFQIWI